MSPTAQLILVALLAGDHRLVAMRGERRNIFYLMQGSTLSPETFKQQQVSRNTVLWLCRKNWIVGHHSGWYFLTDAGTKEAETVLERLRTARATK